VSTASATTDWWTMGVIVGLALVTVIAPEIVMTQGHLITTLHDARVYAAVVGAAYFYWRRGVLGTMLAGMAVYLPLHLGLGW
jgi:branched-subunit amino acid transport protein